MIKSISRKMKYLLVAVFSLVLSFAVLLVSMPNAKAAYDAGIKQYYNYLNGDFVEGSTQSKDGRLTWNIAVSEVRVGSDGSQDIVFILEANQTLRFVFDTTGRSLNSFWVTNIYLYWMDEGTTPRPKGDWLIECTGFRWPDEGYSDNNAFYWSASSSDPFYKGGPYTTDQLIFEVTNNNAEKIKYIISCKNTSEDAIIMGYFYTQLPTVTVDFNKQGGTGGTNSISANIGEAMPPITLPTKTGYTFNGYYSGTNGSGTKYYNANGSSATSCPSSNLTLYACWVANTYTVRYNGNKPAGASGNVTNIPSNAIWTYDSNATLGATPTLAGYTFGGWYREASCTNKLGNAGQDLTKPNLTTTNGATVDLYAKWTANTYTVTLDKNDGIGGSNQVTATYDSAMPSATMPTRTGYNFLGYYDTQAATGGTQYYSSTGTSARTWNKTSNTTLYARWQLKAEIQDVIDKINTIGGSTSVEYPTSKSKIVDAENAYANLIAQYSEYENVDALVTKHTELEQDRTVYEGLRNDAIDDVKNLIDAIGTVTYPDSKGDIDDARSAYNNLDEEDLDEITNYGILTAAEAEYASQGVGKINEVIAAINAINPNITYPGSEEELTNANDLYDALDDNERSSVSNYDALTGYNATYATLKGEAVSNVISLIDAIITTTPLVYPDVEEKINAARTAFDALGNNDKNKDVVTNYQTLIDAEAVSELVNYINNIGKVEDTESFREKVSTARTNYDALTNDQKDLFPTSILNNLTELETIVSVMDAINDIGDVEYTDASQAKIEAANNAYAALDDELKDSVANYDKLVQANTDYDKVDESAGKINNIPEFEFTPAFKDIIDDARNTYNALTPYQKGVMPQDILDKLLEAERKYNAIDSIVNIGDVENTKESRNRVRKAKEAYDALTNTEKQIISDEALKNLNDALAVVDVIEEVNSVKNAGYTTKDKENIDATRTSYNALTEDQKELFPANTLEMLTNIETTYQVMVTINQLGKVEYTDDFKAKLDSVKAIYDSLTDAQKKLVRNYVVLSVDMQSYNRVDDAYKAIEAIDKVKYNSSSKEAIDDARKKYNKLSDKEKELIPNEEEKLLKAEKKYEKAEHSHNVGMGWLTAICVIFGVVIIATGLWLLILLLLKKKREKEEENKKNSKKSKK